MAHLRAKVAAYLEEQGQTGSGDYYVKIYLGEEPGVAKGEWVVVRYTREPATRLTLLASDPVYGYPNYSRYGYDYMPFGWFGFSSLAFRYYDDPYYQGYSGYPYYRPAYPRFYGNRPGRDRWPDRDHDHAGRGDRDQDGHHHHPGGRPPEVAKPSFIPSNVNPVNRYDRSRNYLGPRNPPVPGVLPVNRYRPSVATPAGSGVNRPETSRDRAGRHDSGSRRYDGVNNPVPVRRYEPRERRSMPGSQSVGPGAEAPPVRPVPAYVPPAASVSVPANDYSPPASRSNPEPDRIPRTNTNDSGRRARGR